jgi:hypothetical protein
MKEVLEQSLVHTMSMKRNHETVRVVMRVACSNKQRACASVVTPFPNLNPLSRDRRHQTQNSYVLLKLRNNASNALREFTSEMDLPLYN